MTQRPLVRSFMPSLGSSTCAQKVRDRVSAADQDYCRQKDQFALEKQHLLRKVILLEKDQVQAQTTAERASNALYASTARTLFVHLNVSRQH
jgi:hypothetical protein